MEIWDGYYQNGSLAGVDLVRGEEIPNGLYHLCCQVLVRHTDGDYLLMQRDFSKHYGGCFEATAGGSAIKGEDKYSCAKRELFEETGIKSDNFREISYVVSDENKCIYPSFLCITDCKKDSVILQKGETVSYKWVSEWEFIAFINSDEMIEGQKKRLYKFFYDMGYLEE